MNISIPTEWEDVTLGEFVALSKLDINDFSNELDYYVRMLKIFGNTDIDDIIEFIKVSDIIDISNQMSFMKAAPRVLDKKNIKIDGVTYKLIDNMNEITLGEYITIETLIEKDKLNSVSAIPAILSVVLRPENEDFDSNLCTSRIELFKEKLSIEDVLGMSVFFWTGVR